MGDVLGSDVGVDEAGDVLGSPVGDTLGSMDGMPVGADEAGDALGRAVGNEGTGAVLGIPVGNEDTGEADGSTVGNDDMGDALGSVDGMDDAGETLGVSVGNDDGLSVSFVHGMTFAGCDVGLLVHRLYAVDADGLSQKLCQDGASTSPSVFMTMTCGSGTSASSEASVPLKSTGAT